MRRKRHVNQHLVDWLDSAVHELEQLFTIRFMTIFLARWMIYLLG